MEHLNGIEEYEEIEIFNMVRNGELKRYPKYFWSGSDGRTRAINILKYVLEYIVKWDYDDIIQNFNAEFFGQYKIRGILSRVFHSSPFEALDAVYPNKFKRWQFVVPDGFWQNDENIIEAIKDIYEGELGVKCIEDIYSIKNHFDIFNKYTLYTIMRTKNKSMHDVLRICYPQLQESKFRSSDPYNYVLENQIEIFKKYVENNKLEHREITKLTQKQLKKMDVSLAIIKKYHLRIHDFVELAYPGEYKPWEFSYVGMLFWKDEENIKRAVIWLFEEKMCIKFKNVIRISIQDFLDNDLQSLVYFARRHRITMTDIIKIAYPNCSVKFKK